VDASTFGSLYFIAETLLAVLVNNLLLFFILGSKAVISQFKQSEAPNVVARTALLWQRATDYVHREASGRKQQRREGLRWQGSQARHASREALRLRYGSAK